jgi:hypothetical protein
MNNFMKQLLVITVMALFFSLDSSAQVDRRIGNSQYKNNSKNKQHDPIQTSIDFLKKELKLDAFQEAAVKNLLTDNQAERTKILELDASDREKVDKINLSLDKFDKELESLLNPEQIKLFEIIKEKRKKASKK